MKAEVARRWDPSSVVKREGGFNPSFSTKGVFHEMPLHQGTSRSFHGRASRLESVSEHQGKGIMTVNPPPLDDELIDKALAEDESYTFDCKRIKKDLAKILETIIAFANTEGGTVALGLEDADKARGRDRVFGIQENLMNWDELRRLIRSRITEPDLLPISHNEVGCTLKSLSENPGSS
jgi:hypothetical protein